MAPSAIEALGDAIDATVFGLPGSGLTLVTSQVIGSAVASVTVTGAFSTTYDAYKIVIANTVTSAASTINITLGSTATGYYYVTAAGLFSTGASSNQNGAANATSWLAVGSTPTTNVSNSLEILSPFSTAKTFYNATYVNVTGGAAGNLAGYLNDTTSYTAFTLTPSIGNFNRRNNLRLRIYKVGKNGNHNSKTKYSNR
jgi:hypothetical protein